MRKPTATVVIAVEPAAIPFKDFYTSYYKCSRQHAYGLISSGRLETFLDDGKRMVLLENARKCVANLASKGGAISAAVSAKKASAGRKGVEAIRAMRRESEAA